jgi:drug/metabolite transporter, DME family
VAALIVASIPRVRRAGLALRRAGSAAGRAGALDPRGGRRRDARTAGGAAAVLTAAAAWGSTGTAAHFAPAGTSSASVGAARIALGGALLLALGVRTAGSRQAIARLLAGGDRPWRARATVGLAAAAVAGYQVCFFTAVRVTGVAIGTVVAIGSAPVLTGLLTRLTGGPILGRRWAVATTAAVAGCVVLVTGGRASGVRPHGVLLALAAGLCYAIYAVAAAGLISRGSPETAVMGLLFGGAAVLLAPVLAAGHDGWLMTGRGLAVVGYLGVITTAAAYLLYGRGLRTVSAPVAVTIGLAEPAVAALLGLVVLGERIGVAAVAGLILIGFALVGLAVGRAADQVPPGPPG